MFNAPRPTQRILSGNAGFGGSFVDDNGPLAGSAYDGLDPWSGTATPSPPPMPSGTTSVFNSVIADATLPTIYNKAFDAIDTAGTGEATVNSLSRVLGTSGLPAATIDKIVNLVSSRPRVSKLEFFVALALVALAQNGKDISVEQVASLASQNSLPAPSLDLSTLPTSASDLNLWRQNSQNSPAPAYTTSADPWDVNPYANPPRPGGSGRQESASGGILNGASGGVVGTGLPSGWWNKQESVHVNVKGQQGFILKRYMVYEVVSERGGTVPRRYSEFIFLWECLVRRYPFRLLPALPPKRLGPDEQFIEQRRKGLARFLNFVINHPVIKEDGLLAIFLTESSLEAWRKHTSISLEEESASKRVDRVEEMSIPSDLEEKLTLTRGKVSALIEHWQKICIFAERMIKRRESAAADVSRMTNTIRALVEVNERCWRGDECELCAGVRQGVGRVATHCQRHADLLDHRSRTLLYSTLEALKAQRDLYIALRDLLIRHDRLSVDQVEKLRKRVEANSFKLEGIKAAQKDGWQDEADKMIGSIEKDQVSIAAQLHRRVFVRACMWHELRVVLHNRENALVTQATRTFASEERRFTEEVASNWASLSDAVEEMPYE